ncbi:methionine ABC transporter ATP-binding protein [Tessaracoccus sp. MC1756]|uniref:methionine ABC transporter ATP-binding protein n=1 Tax=Tessaracoccus sp. MC1756 TaxID=2760311 RepID=UPI0016006D6B|nr:ATP-binding cassette domain-containing protein [Tessaracoccus sp. MC1756]MBB1508358.1 ATP-binding cassette domain-containing protein [Tessaracoccus sp. MC1756]
MITVTDLRKVYHQGKREVRALDGVSLTVPAGSIHGVIGHSGAGKSTLVRCLTMLDRPSSGTVEINGVDLTAARSDALRTARRRIGLVFQQANLFDSRTILANVAYPLELIGVSREKRHEKAQELLRLVGLSDAGNAYPAQLSGGMRQRVGIARALATDPDVLLFDEPTSALDPRTTDEILDLIVSLRDRSPQDLAVLVITHEMHVVKKICDSVSLLEAGRIVESGPLTQAVQHLSGRLSQALLGIPPHAPVEASDATLVDVLASGDRAALPMIAHTSGAVGADLAIVAGSVEQLAGTTFSHLRLAVPHGTDANRVVDELKLLGADARLTTEIRQEEPIA